jgi:hypothetical protein
MCFWFSYSYLCCLSKFMTRVSCWVSTLVYSNLLGTERLVVVVEVSWGKLIINTPSGPFYLAQVRMTQSPRLHFDHSFALYYIIYTCKIIITG